jgi:hypothetical protein
MFAVRLIEQVGAYAGLAAIPGLAVLSALYFSQARDVRRLREWAGRAPERAAELAQGGRVAAQPQTTGAQPATAAQPAAAAAAATPAAVAGAAVAKPATPGVSPGVAKPAVATAAGAQAATAAGPAAAEADNTDQAATNGEGPSEAKPAADKPAALTPAAVASAAAAKGPAAGAKPAGGAGSTVTRTGPPAVGGVKPATAGSPIARKPIPRMPSSQTSVLTPTSPPREPWYRRLAARLPAARYVALIVAGALVLGGGAAFGISQLASDDSGSGSSDKSAADERSNRTPAQDETPKDEENVTARPAVNPADVTVTVVNGTTIPNLARDTAAKLSTLGFQIGNKVTGTGSLAAAESVVQYKPGAEDEARYVAAKLDISQKQPADPDALAQAGPAEVIVVLGADQAPGG